MTVEEKAAAFLSNTLNSRKFLQMWKRGFFESEREQLDTFCFRSQFELRRLFGKNKDLEKAYNELKKIVNMEDQSPLHFLSLWRGCFFEDYKEELNKIWLSSSKSKTTK